MFRRYACVRQRDQSDCGAAALATLALHYRRPIGLEAMRDLAGTDRIGTNLLGLLDAAEKLSFTTKAVKGPFEALAQVPLPAIAHVKTEEGLGHFMVLYRVARGFSSRSRPGTRDPEADPRRVLPAVDRIPPGGGTRAQRGPCHPERRAGLPVGPVPTPPPSPYLRSY